MGKAIKKLLCMAAVIGAYTLFCLSPTPFIVFADGGEISAITSVSEEITIEYPLMYTFEDSDGKTAQIELQDGSNVKMTLYVEGAELASIFGWYERISENIIDIYAYDEWFGTYELREDGTAISVDYNEDVEDSQTESELPDGMIPETEGSKWFEKYIAPYLKEYGVTVLGVATAIVLLLGKIKKVINKAIELFNAAIEALKKSNKDNEQTQSDIKKQNEDLETWKKETRAELDKALLDMKKQVVDKVADTNTTVHKLLEVEEIAYEENPVLVSNGTAKKIAEVLHHEQKENET